MLGHPVESQLPFKQIATLYLIDGTPLLSSQYVGSILKDVFLVFPQYCLGRGLMDMATEMNINLIVAKFGFISERNRYSWDFLGKYMACMVIQVSRIRAGGVIRFLMIVLSSGRYENVRGKGSYPLPIIVVVGGLVSNVIIIDSS